MTDLLFALILLGALIIASVVIYNMLQERKLRKEITSGFIVPRHDVLADNFSLDADAFAVEKEMAEITSKHEGFYAKESSSPERLEPSSDKMPTSEPSSSEYRFRESKVDFDFISSEQSLNLQADLTSDETIGSARKTSVERDIVPATAIHELDSLQNRLPEETHGQVDLTAILFASIPIKVADLAGLVSTMSEMGSLPLMIHGLNEGEKWRLLDTVSPVKQTFKQITCSIQLADRGGPINRSALNKFQFLVEEIGLNLNAHVEWQGSGDAMLRATELDQFCMEVDQLINIHVGQSGNPIHGTKFKGLAEANGMILGDDGKFHMLSKANQMLQFVIIDGNNQPFTIDNLRTNVIKSFTFQLEIPKVANCETIFNEMIVVAKQMANSLNAYLVDDHQKVLGDLQIEKIRQQLRVIHAKMVARSIMPGSPSAIRLFN
jgi:FtsZ-interacting cell division protein ZipA